MKSRNFSLAGIFASILLFVTIVKAQALGQWTLIKPANNDPEAVYTNSTGYALMMIRGLLQSSNCQSNEVYSQNGCAYSGQCLGQQDGFAQCPGNIYFGEGAQANCTEILPLIGNSRLVQYTMTCSNQISGSGALLQPTDSFEDNFNKSSESSSASSTSSTQSSSINSSPSTTQTSLFVSLCIALTTFCLY
ncbi:hypothetical protein BB559_003050 [Furculomyces boomerangus]|uniref:SUEL-type lectin domain-containing protein n=2 Tax=Harpellales TaxID=61421 RepID=A0A2T9YPD1_9FUNG|nr:hypothetical protein BB559_005455 [Furculomyces boomerangus]PVU94210.1 hypothetical protein BB559_003050 [Furculomyces boomerangus]PVZ99523.1 hypothetical protein BB558_004472 [Smittium angustum]